MMTVVVVGASLRGLLVGCVLLTVVVTVTSVWEGMGVDAGTVLVVVVAPSLVGLLVGCMVWEWVGVDTVERKHTSCHFT